MKFFALLAIVGFAGAVRLSGNAELKWQPEHEYVYSYKGRLLTGLPELSERHFSGMGIHAKVHLSVLSPHRVSLRVSEAQYSRFNQELQPQSGSQDGHNWRHLPLPGYAPVPSETMRLLGQPTVFELEVESGKVRNVIVSAEEPEWSVNFKKALIVLFQTQAAEYGAVKTNSLDEFVSRESVPYQNYWTTMEESVDGECETRYELNELPESRIYDEEILPRGEGQTRPIREYEPVSLPSACKSGSKVYEIIKVRNVNKCVVRSAFSFYKPGGYECQPGSSRSKNEGRAGNCEGTASRSSVTRYTVCGKPEESQSYVILSIVNEGELNQDLMGFKSEKMMTGTRQVLNLLEKRSGLSGSHQKTPSSPVTLESLIYEHSSLKKQTPEQMKRELHHNGEHSVLKSVTFGLESAIKGGRKEEVKQEMKQLIRKIVEHDLFTVEGLPETEITMKALGVSKGFTALTKEEIEHLYRELKSELSSSEEKKHVFRNVFFDTAVMSGTVPAIRFLKKMIMENEMSPYMAQSVLLSLAGSVVTPTTPLLEELYELVVSPKIKELSRESNLYNSAILGYSSLIEKACLSDNRNTSYPTFVFGKFCHHDSYIVTEKWIPHLSRKIREEQSIERRSVYVVALGLLSHKNTLPALTYVLDTPESPRNSPLLRTLAVYSLTKTGRHHPRAVLPILSAVFANRAEKTEVRVAAFNVMMKLQPDQFYLQKIATLTWIETDLEILKLVNTAFYSLTHATSMQDVKPESADLVRKVRILYPLIRKTGGRFPTTGTLYMNDYLKHLNVGFEKVSSWTATKDSSFPSDIYSKLSYFLDNYRYTPLEYSLHLRGTGSLIQEIIEIISGKTEKASEDSSVYSTMENEIVDKVSGEWKKIVEKLNIEPRRDTERPEAALYVNIFETYPIFKSFAKETRESLRQQVKNVLRNPMGALRAYGPGSESNMINYQRLINLAPQLVQIPSDMGLPIAIELHMPLVLSVRGRVEPQSMNMNSISLKTKFHAMATVQYTGWVGTICPFTGDYVRTGIDQHATVNFPQEFQVVLDRSNQEMKVKMVPTPSGIRSGSGKVDLFHYHVRPYTVSQKVTDLKPMSKSSSYKIIRSDSFPKQRDQPMPQEKSVPILKSLGLGLTLNYLSDVSYGLITPTLMRKFMMYNYNPMNVLRFALASTAVSPTELPSVRTHFIKIQQHPELASTKEIEFTIKYGLASKESQSVPVMYHTLEKSESESKVLPLKLVSKPIGEAPKHPRRQAKIAEIVRESGIESGHGIGIQVETRLIGSKPRTISYTLLASFGKHAEIKTKWNVRLESDQNKKVCFRGVIDLPLTSVYNIEKILSEENRYKFESELAFGQQCEKIIRVVGHTRTSGEAKETVQKSKIAQELKKLMEKRVPLIGLSKMAEKVRRMASVLDEVDFEIQYENMPRPYVFYGEKVIDFVKIYYLPYLFPLSGESYPIFSSEYSTGSESFYTSTMRSISRSLYGSESEIESEIESSEEESWAPRSLESLWGKYPSYEEESTLESGSERSSGKVVYKIKFHPLRKTFSLVIVRSNGEQIKFHNIRIPFPLSYYFPISTAVSPVYSAEKSLTGMNYSPVCRVERNTLSTYDNKTLPMELTEDNFHLLSALCSMESKWSVQLSKSTRVPGYKNVKIIIETVPVLLYPVSSEPEIEVRIAEQRVSIRKGETKHVYEHGVSGGRVLATIYKANDGAISFKSDYFTLVFNGIHMEITPIVSAKSKLCGLCGNFNSDKSDDMMSPRMCLLSKPKLFVASWAVPKSGMHSAIPEHIKEELKKETEERCIKVYPSSGISGAIRRGASKVHGSSGSMRWEEFPAESGRWESGRWESPAENKWESGKWLSGNKWVSGESGKWESEMMSEEIASEAELMSRYESRYGSLESLERLEREYYPSSTSEEYSSGYETETMSPMEWSSYSSGPSRCYRRAHHIVYRTGKVCISRQPFSACRSGECKPVSETTVETSFHCFREGSPRASQFVRRVHNGEELPELRTMSVDVVRSVPQPTSCKPTRSYEPYTIRSSESWESTTTEYPRGY